MSPRVVLGIGLLYVALAAAAVVTLRPSALDMPLETPLTVFVPAEEPSDPSVPFEIREPSLVRVTLDLIAGSGNVNPMLALVADAVGSGAACERMSPLSVNRYYMGDTLYLDIGAYAIRRDTDTPCPESPVRAPSTIIPIDDALETDIRPTNIILRDATNQYRLRKDVYAVYLEPIHTRNVVPASTEQGGSRVVLCLQQSADAGAPAECRP